VERLKKKGIQLENETLISVKIIFPTGKIQY
jgi:hypothetical protein